MPEYTRKKNQTPKQYMLQKQTEITSLVKHNNNNNRHMERTLHPLLPLSQVFNKLWDPKHTYAMHT